MYFISTRLDVTVDTKTITAEKLFGHPFEMTLIKLGNGFRNLLFGLREVDEVDGVAPLPLDAEKHPRAQIDGAKDAVRL